MDWLTIAVPKLRLPSQFSLKPDGGQSTIVWKAKQLAKFGAGQRKHKNYWFIAPIVGFAVDFEGEMSGRRCTEFF